MSPSAPACRVLVVDDEPGMRDLARRILASAGYGVLTARCGEEALRLLAADIDRVDLVLTDVVMPHMSGDALAQRILHLRRGIRVLYMSGYSDGILGLNQLDDLIEKPFDRDALLAAVERALASDCDEELACR